MIKKIILLILCFSILSTIAVVSVNAADSIPGSDTSLSEHAIKSIDVLDGCGVNIVYDEKGYVTNGNFAVALLQALGFYNGENENDAIKILKDYGVIPSTKRFLPATIITTDNAYEICINALGYKDKAILSGYSKLVLQLDLSKNVKAAVNLKYGDCALILYNMLMAPVNEVVGIGKDYIIYQSGSSFIETYCNMIHIKGTIMACENAGIGTYEQYSKENHIYINGYDIETQDNSINKFLGYTAEVFVKKNDLGIFSLSKYFISENTKSVTIKMSDVKTVKGYDSGDPFSDRAKPYISYYDGSRTKTAKIDSGATILYNGNRTTQLQNNNLKGDTGTICLVDYNNDGSYDVLSAEKYEIGKIISINKNDYYFVLENSIYVKIEDVDRLTVEQNGKEIPFSDLEIGMLVALFRPLEDIKDGTYEIKVFENTVQGTLSSLGVDERLLSVDDVEYSYNSEFVTDLKLGRHYTFHLDDNNVVVYAIESKNDSTYAYFVEYAYDRVASKYSLIFNVYESDNKEHEYIIKQPVRYTGFDGDGNWVENKKFDREAFDEVLAAHFNEHTLIKIKKQGDVITEIIMPEDKSQEMDYKGWTNESFTLEESFGINDKNLLHYPKIISRNYTAWYKDSVVVVDDSTPGEEEIFMAPYTANSLSRILLASYGLDKAYIYDGYVEDNYLMYDRTLSCSAFVVKHSMEYVPDNFILPIPNENNRVPFIVSYVSRVIDNDILTYRVFGTLNNVEVSYVAESEEVTQKYSTKYAAKNCCTVGELKSGYVIYTELNESGRLSSFYLISR